MSTLSRMVALTLIAVILGTGLCLLDADHTTQGLLCVACPAATSGPLLAVSLVLTDLSLPAPVKARLFHPPDLPTPPPKV